MTRTEAIEWIYTIDTCYDLAFREREALDMAIEALQAEPTKAVPPSIADVYKWERDIALSQLEEYGIGFAEKKRDDLVEVVRCKDCEYADFNSPYPVCNLLEMNINEDGYCSWARMKGGAE